MVTNLDNILTAINQLQQNGLIVEGSLHGVSADLTTLKTALPMHARWFELVPFKIVSTPALNKFVHYALGN